MDRPKKVNGRTHRYETTCGSLYVTVGKDKSTFIEVRAILGKSGSCAQCQNLALSDAISLGLRAGINPKAFISCLKDVSCPASNSTEEGCRSCSDGIARALEEELNAPDS